MGVLVHFYRRRDQFSDPKIVFFAFFEAKMTKNDIPNPKLIDPNDNQPFYIRIFCFFWVSLTFDFLTLFECGVKVHQINPNGTGGHIVPALFSDACFSLKLKCWRAQISWLFPYAYGEPPYNLSEAPNSLKWGF